MAENVVAKWLEMPIAKSEPLPSATSTIATIATKPTTSTPHSSISINSESSIALKTKNGQEKTARKISSILSGLYRKISPDKWEHLRLNHPEWMKQRNDLENELDGYFLNNDPEAGQKVFYRLVKHLKDAPVLDQAQELRQ